MPDAISDDQWILPPFDGRRYSTIQAQVHFLILRCLQNSGFADLEEKAAAAAAATTSAAARNGEGS